MPSPKNEIRKEIADLINRIKEQSDRIGAKREIPQMEVDLILHRIEELHRKTVVWSYLNEQPEEVSGSGLQVPGTEQSAFGSAQSDKVVQEEKVLKNDIQTEKFEAPLNPEPSAFGSAQSDKVTKEEKVLKNDIQTEKFEAPSNPEPSALGSAQSDKVTQEEKVVAPKPVNEIPKTDAPAQKQLKDVRSFVGFNEKIMYIRQVFGGDNAAYEEALNQVNAMQSWAEAEAYLSVLAAEYKWNKDNEPVAIFTQTVKRRFS